MASNAVLAHHGKVSEQGRKRKGSFCLSRKEKQGEEGRLLKRREKR